MMDVFAAGGGRDRRASLLAALLVVALIFCHGFFGGLHLVSDPPGLVASAGGAHAGGAAGGHTQQHVESTHGTGGAHDPVAHPGTSDYYAVVLLVAFGAALGLLIRDEPGASRTRERTPRGDVFARVAEVAVLARGPDRRVLLQVFRL